jgi:hypothetical protein
VPTCPLTGFAAEVETTSVPPPSSGNRLDLLIMGDGYGAGQSAALAAGADRTFVVTGSCGVPATAWAVVVNATITSPTAVGNLRLYPDATPVPAVSSLNYSAGQTRGNGAIVALGAGGGIRARVTQASGTAHLVLDVNGYFE